MNVHINPLFCLVVTQASHTPTSVSMMHNKPRPRKRLCVSNARMDAGSLAHSFGKVTITSRISRNAVRSVSARTDALVTARSCAKFASSWRRATSWGVDKPANVGTAAITAAISHELVLP